MTRQPANACPRPAAPGTRVSLVLCLLLALPATTLAAGLPDAPARSSTERYIVLARDASALAELVGSTRQRLGFRAQRTFRHAVRGFAARLTDAQRAALEDDPAVEAVVPDLPVKLTAQTLPDNIDRVDADRSKIAAISGDGGNVDVDIAIIDTGIDANHDDLNVVGGKDCSRNDGDSWADGQGHGTHVAGTAAARDNGFGVVGVAPGARLWSVRVFNSRAESYFSWVICGIDWVTAQRDPGDPSRPRIEVMSMSLRGAGGDDGRCGSVNDDPVHRAVCASVDAGVTVVVAAGNDGTDARRWIPASYDEAITVSAIGDFDGRSGGEGGGCNGTADDRFAGFSNHGPDVDITAPGVCIVSTLPGERYGTSTGTSMATPAVAGGAALYLAGHPNARPAQVRLALIEAGRRDWLLGSDPDSLHEPLLNVASFGLDPAFTFTASPASVMRGPGQRATYRLTVARVGGHDAPIDFSVSGLPAGASASFDPPTAPAGREEVTLTVDLPQQGDHGDHTLAIEGRAADRVVTRNVLLVFSASLVPEPGGPVLDFTVGSTLGEYKVPLVVRWGRVDRASVYQLQSSAQESPWRNVALENEARERTSVDGWPDQLVRYRVRALVGGEWRPWRTGPATIPKPYHENGYGIRYAGDWDLHRVGDALGGRYRVSTDAGATATLGFTGLRVAWISERGPNQGRAKIVIDGVHVATVDLHASSRQPRRAVFRWRFDGSGAHRIKLRVLPTPGRQRVVLDDLYVIS